ncbi:hypothetical protein CFOL_v3_22671 [Cephalotus follicularis]|uniref:Uncharacterized protein n=1 Tax=Cephalotus follicularis TaxID=3775 RepID=A0A1Q3CG16_CEPFO|nr:hypothetical protein CFOL_v3_22671 [Cephalotus follicularis]
MDDDILFSHAAELEKLEKSKDIGTSKASTHKTPSCHSKSEKTGSELRTKGIKMVSTSKVVSFAPRVREKRLRIGTNIRETYQQVSAKEAQRKRAHATAPKASPSAPRLPPLITDLWTPTLSVHRNESTLCLANTIV